MTTVTETLAYIETPVDVAKPFAAGIVLWNDGYSDRVVEAAPIVGYMKRGKWTRVRVRDWCHQKGWKITVVNQTQRTI